MRVTLIGGSGFIGQHAARALVDAGADVSVVHRGKTPLRAAGARSVVADRRNGAELASALASAGPTVVIDMTAYTGDDMEHLVSALPDSVERLVVISSGDVYWTYGVFLGLTTTRVPSAAPLDERAPLREQLYPYRAQASSVDDLLYHYDKIVVERTARGSGVAVTTLRLPMVYGPADPQRRIVGYMDRLEASGGTLRINAAEAAWRCTRGYVEDVAWAIRLAALDDRAAGEIFNVGEVDGLTELEWIRSVASAAGWSGVVLSEASTPQSLPVEWSMPLVVETGKIRDALGYREPVGRHEGLRRTLASTRLHISE